ncbi:MAG: hypothetical protein R3C15_13505 [Thermoleophilia bacterium]
MQSFPLDDRGSFAWLAHPEEPMARASCALVVDGGSLVIDPVDAPGLDEALAPLGPPLGVVTLLDRHQRDAAAIAARLGCRRVLPRALDGEGVRLDGVEERTVTAGRGWKEALLWLPERRLLVCAEAVGTGAFYLAREGDRLGVHPFSRLLRIGPAFAGLRPDVLAVGHGPPLTEGAADALERALSGKLRDLPRAWGRAVALGLRTRGALKAS